MAEEKNSRLHKHQHVPQTNSKLLDRVVGNRVMAQKIRRDLAVRLAGSPVALRILDQLSDEQLLRRYIHFTSVHPTARCAR